VSREEAKGAKADLIEGITRVVNALETQPPSPTTTAKVGQHFPKKTFAPFAPSRDTQPLHYAP